MEPGDHLAHIESNAEAIAEMARLGTGSPVPACPGWTVGHVVAHVGRAMNWIGEIVETRAQTPVQPRPNDHSFDPKAPDLLSWFEDSTARFLLLMKRTDPDEHVWSWSGDNRVAFWLRLMAHETAIHGWDVQSAHQHQEPVDPSLSTDAIDGALHWFVASFRADSLLPSLGELYFFKQTDSDGRWSLHFEGNDVKIDRDGTGADLLIEATGSDILLFLWHRLDGGGLTVTGDPALLGRFHELAPVP